MLRCELLVAPLFCGYVKRFEVVFVVAGAERFTICRRIREDSTSYLSAGRFEFEQQ